MRAHMTEGLQRLISILEAVDNSQTSKCGFDMGYPANASRYSRHPCGTACCIGGHAALELGDKDFTPEKAVMQMCELSESDAIRICYPSDCGWFATPAQAVSLLKHYGATGYVDWDLAMAVAA